MTVVPTVRTMENKGCPEITEMLKELHVGSKIFFEEQ
jgi:hypothetical protein